LASSGVREARNTTLAKTADQNVKEEEGETDADLDLALTTVAAETPALDHQETDVIETETPEEGHLTAEIAETTTTAEVIVTKEQADAMTVTVVQNVVIAVTAKTSWTKGIEAEVQLKKEEERTVQDVKVLKTEMTGRDLHQGKTVQRERSISRLKKLMGTLTKRITPSHPALHLATTRIESMSPDQQLLASLNSRTECSQSLHFNIYSEDV